MAENNLKKALSHVFWQEINKYPNDIQLAEQYTFSRHFQQEMESLVKRVKEKYIIIFGKAINRNTIAILFSVVVLFFLSVLCLNGTLSAINSRFIFSVFELFLLMAFGTSIRKKPKSFGGSYRTAFQENEDEELEDALEFPMPQPPQGYEKSKEYRTITEHTVEYTDGMGRVIHYNRTAIKNGFLRKIETGNAAIRRLTINGFEAMIFTNGFETNLVWADKIYRYHMHGNCSEEILLTMAENMK